MTTLTHPLSRDCVNSLGIPVDNLSLPEAIERIVHMARARDGRARLVSTLNVDFIVNSLGFAFSRPAHPELLKVLRTSDMVTADGFPIIWLSKIVGKPLKQRVTGSDMVPALAQRAVRENLSLFLLGGGEGVAAAAADTLKTQNPGLRIAGTAAPYVHTAGPGLTDFATADELLLEQINNSGAEILLVGLGNPKQELWFNRNRHKLTVPVSIGVGGTFEFITGSVKRAPAWIQRLNMEWLFRLTQDPRRLWQRYAKGLIKLALLTAPLLYYRIVESLLYTNAKRTTAPGIHWNSVWSSRDQSLEILRLPPLVTREYLEQVVGELKTRENSVALSILDFCAVKHVEIAAHQEFFALAELLRNPQNNLSMLGLSDRVRRHLSACRVMDILGSSGSDNTLSAISGSDQAVNDFSLGCKSYVIGNSALIFLSGQVDGKSLANLGFAECLRHTARDRNCILDFRNVSLLESSAIAQLHPIVAGEERTGGQIRFSGAGASVRQMFRVARLDQPARFISDVELLAHIAQEGTRHD